MRFSNSIVQILDFALTFFKSSSKDASTTVAVAECIKHLAYKNNDYVAVVDTEKYVTHNIISPINF